MMPTKREVAEVIMKIGRRLIERKHLDKEIKKLKMVEDMDMLKNLFIQ